MLKYWCWTKAKRIERKIQVKSKKRKQCSEADFSFFFIHFFIFDTKKLSTHQTLVDATNLSFYKKNFNDHCHLFAFRFSLFSFFQLPFKAFDAYIYFSPPPLLDWWLSGLIKFKSYYLFISLLTVYTVWWW